MATRRITSLTALLVFVALAFTSIFTYLAPRDPGSSDWTALGVSKHKWLALHTDLGIVFLVVGIIHILNNLKPITAYLKDQFGKSRVFNINFNLALLITLWVVISSLFSLPPFGAVQNFKYDHETPERPHLEEVTEAVPETVDERKPLPEKPPMFYSGRSLKRLSGTYQMDVPGILAGLQNVGITAKEDWTFKEIAKRNDMETKAVYEAVLQVQ